jgi:HPt (histidine-containing phosphotransfer) domain-containing protein
LLNLCCGDVTFARGVVEQFKTQAPAELARLGEALNSGNAKDFTCIAHSLKSMSAYVTADVAADLSRQLEELGRADRLCQTTPLLQRLKEEIERILDLIPANLEAGVPAGV